MTEPKYKFLAGVLGQDGADALQKAAEHSPGLESVLLPRTILAFLSCAQEWEFDGSLPGVEQSHLLFRKNEDDTYSGCVKLGEANCPFEHSSVYHVAAGVAYVLGLEDAGFTAPQGSQLQRLGKSIDLLAKAEAIRQAKKSEGPGPANAPNPQQGPGEPEAPKKQPATSKPPVPKTAQVAAPPVPKDKVAKVKAVKLPGVKLTRSQVQAKCPMCRHKQFTGDEFTGCFCFADLSKGVEASVFPDGSASLEFSPEDWDNESIRVLVESMRVR